MQSHYVRWIALAAVVGAIAINHRLGRRWGATREEACSTLPGDDVIAHPIWETTHGVTIRASAAEVWPWLVQMGITRGGWYLSQRLDRIVWRIDNPSVDHIVPELQQLAVGDVVPDSVNETAHFLVRDLQPNRALVLHSRRHPITGILPDPAAGDAGLYLDFSWTFALRESGHETTRLLLRSRAVVMRGNRKAPCWLRIFFPLVDFADFLYTRQMLHGIRRRVERTSEPIEARPQPGRSRAIYHVPCETRPGERVEQLSSPRT